MDFCACLTRGGQYRTSILPAGASLMPVGCCCVKKARLRYEFPTSVLYCQFVMLLPDEQAESYATACS